MGFLRARGALVAAVLLEAAPLPLPFFQPPFADLSPGPVVLLAAGHERVGPADKDGDRERGQDDHHGRETVAERPARRETAVRSRQRSSVERPAGAVSRSTEVPAVSETAVVAAVAQPVASPSPAPVAPAAAPLGALPAAVTAAAPVRPVLVRAAPAAVAAPGPDLGVARRTRPNPALEGVPDIFLPPGPESQRLAVALLALPLLLGIWLWALLRLSVSAWSLRGAAARSAVAHQLGLRTEQLAAVDAEGLRRLRDGIAFDELTGVLRRAAGLAALDRELARAGRSGQPVSVAFVDVDGLKAANDNLGHAAGDALLLGVAGVLLRRLRAQDLVFRYGGDEFVCVMPGTARPRAEAIAQEMRLMGAGDGFHFSFGVAQAHPGETARAVIGRADSLQYLDKQSRRGARG